MSLELLSFLVILQSFIILLSGCFSIFISKRRNLVFFLFCIVYFLLVCGQNLWLIQKIKDNGSFSHFYQYTIDASSLYAATFLSFLFTFIVFSTYFLFSFSAKKYLKENNCSHVTIRKKREVRWIASGVSSLFVIFGGIYLIQLLGGLTYAFSNPGQLVEGQSAALFLVLIGKFPLLYRIYKRQKPSVLEVLLFVTSFTLIIINSRFLAIFLILQLLALVHYRINNFNLRISAIASLGFVLLVFVFGIYRDSGNYTNSSDARTEAIIARTLNINSTVDWFYSTNVEGFLGLAGILAYQSDNNAFTYDLGKTNLAFISNLIPKALQSALSLEKIVYELKMSYPYQNFTVVPSGLEVAYASFGVFGIILLAFFMGACLNFFDRALKTAVKEDNILNFFLFLILLPHMIALIRTSPGIAFFFALPDFLICFFYYQVQRVILFRNYLRS